MVKTTRKQREALFNVFRRDYPSWVTPFKRKTSDGITVPVSSIRYREFRKKVQPYFGGECVMIHWANMWLGIEQDGYTHS